MRIPSRVEVIKWAREEGKKIAGVLPVHYPRELLRAFGYHPVEIWGPPKTKSMGGTVHLQPYICSIVTQILSFLKEEGFDAVDIIFVPHTCDSMQGLSSILKHFINRKPVVFMYIPRNRDEFKEEFMVKEIERVYRTLCEISGKEVSESELMEAIEREEEVDFLFRETLFNREEYSVSDREFYSCLRTREFLPLETFAEVIKGMPKDGANINGRRILITGILPEPMELFDWINRAGGDVVIDDMACLSRRTYQRGRSDNPFVRIAERLLSSPPDSTRGSSIDERINWIKSLVKEKNVDCVIAYNVKFCEPELFYIPVIEKELKKENIPFLYIEHEINQPFPQSLFNRIQAFLEG